MTKKYISKINKGGNNLYVKDTEAQQNISSHVGNTSNPHSVTKSQVGLSNVTNDAQVKRSEMGAASGVATLDSAGKVPSSQLPSYVDDVLEYDNKSAFPKTGEGGKIYVDKFNNTTWRWSGTAYTQIKGDLVIGTTTGTAADGGTASTHYSNTSNPHGVTKAQVGLGSVVNTGDSATPVSGGTTKFTTGGAYTELAKKVDKVSGKGLSTNDYTTDEKNKLSGIASGAEVNQNAFSNVAVGNTTISADGKTDTLTLVAGSNVTITPDATNDKVTIAATDTTYSAATTSAAGLMSADDKTKLNGIATGATKVTTDTVAGWGYTKNAGTVTGVKINGTTKSPSSGVVDLGTVITDVSGKVNTSTKVNGHALTGDVTVTKSDVGLGNVGDFKAVSTVASQGLTDAEKANARTNIGAGTSSFSGSYNDLSNKPSIPAAANNGTYTVKTLVGSTTTNVSDFTANQSSADDVTFVQGSNVTITPDSTNRKITIAATDTTYSSKSAASGGTDVSLVTTGEKYTWNSKSNFSGSYNDLTNKPTIPTVNNAKFSIKGAGTEVASTTANASDASSVDIVAGTNVTVTPDATNKKITIAATDTTYSSKAAASGGTDVSLVTTGEKYAWNSKTSNTGTVTSVAVKMNGATKGTVTTSGTIDLGTVLTSHQDISGKADKTTTVNGHALSGNVSVTKSDVGLGNVTNDSQVKRSEMGAASGVATLDSNGKVPSSQLPSYVDDVIEGYFYNSKFYKESEHTTEITGETGKIYVDLSTNKTYRWGGSAYAVISDTLALGETSSTAYAGDKGAALKSKLDGIESGAQKHKAPTAAEVKSALGTGSGTSKYLREDGNWVTPPDHTYTVNNGTFTVKGAGTSVSSTSANASSNTSVDIVAGSNVTITPDATNGTITISSTDTNSWRPVSDSVSSTDSSTAASSKAVKTAYDLAATKTSNTGTVTKVTAGTGLTGGDITTTGTIALATSGVTAGTYKRVTVDAYGRVTSGDNTDADTNTARLQVSDTTNKRINTKESTGNYIQFTGGTNKFTVGDGTNSFDVAVTPSVSYPVSSVAGKTGAVTLSSSDVGLGNVGNFKAVSTVASQGLSDTEKSNARANIGAGTSSFSGSYNDLSNKPTIPAAAANGTYTVKTLVGSTTTNVSDFTANQSGTDDVTFVQGSNVTITPDATNRKITIAAKDTTYSAATTTTAGLMSAADKTKLNGIAVSALVVCTTSTLPATLSPNTYYNITDAVSTMTLHLPTITDNNQVSVVAAYFTTNTGVPTVNITADSPATISYFTGYSIEASKSYELNIMWNGTKWIVAYATIG